jgi:hypothetical protein
MERILSSRYNYGSLSLWPRETQNMQQNGELQQTVAQAYDAAAVRTAAVLKT